MKIQIVKDARIGKKVHRKGAIVIVLPEIGIELSKHGFAKIVDDKYKDLVIVARKINPKK